MLNQAIMDPDKAHRTQTNVCTVNADLCVVSIYYNKPIGHCSLSKWICVCVSSIEVNLGTPIRILVPHLNV